jgi:hypothetical protein
MKQYLSIAALAASVLGSSAAVATELPKKFWGEWISIDSSDALHMKLTGSAIAFDHPPSCEFTNIDPANEEATAFDVNWHCPDDAAGVETQMAFRLMRIWGKEALVVVNAETPTVISVYQRHR